jgi:hypothetical protein
MSKIDGEFNDLKLANLKIELLEDAQNLSLNVLSNLSNMFQFG